MSSKNKNILIIGGSSGKGLSLLKTLIDQGTNLYSGSRSRSFEWPCQVNH